MHTSIENKLEQLGYTLPQLPESKGIYKRCLHVGNLLFLSGHLSVNADGSYIAGKLGADCSDETGAYAARQCGLALLASIKAELGSLDRVQRVVKILGMVNSAPDFTRHPLIINGCSELFRQLWGDDAGVGARSAVGMAALPNNVAVEIEAIFEIQ